jgi:DNA-directed RNA polymerase specialized sigma24 family protein
VTPEMGCLAALITRPSIRPNSWAYPQQGMKQNQNMKMVIQMRSFMVGELLLRDGRYAFYLFWAGSYLSCVHLIAVDIRLKITNLFFFDVIRAAEALMSNGFLKFIRFPKKSSVADGTSDEQLIVQIQQNDPDAWAIFLNRYTDVIYRKACDYSQTNRMGSTLEDREDEAADLYLFMSAYLKQSLKSFQGKCKPSTWVLGIISNRPRILKAYLLHKDPDRADVRLPKTLASRSHTDQEIFKRLVWGFDPAYIAQDLHVTEDQCWEIETLLAEQSPRVYSRICANRTARAPHIHMDTEGDEDDHTPHVTVVDLKPNPEQALIFRESQSFVQKALSDIMATFSIEERRILILLYNENLKPAEIVRLSTSDPNLGLAEVDNVNRIYYVKDRALNKICAHMLSHIDQQGTVSLPETKKRDLLSSIETYLSECGLPVLHVSFSK